MSDLFPWLEASFMIEDAMDLIDDYIDVADVNKPNKAMQAEQILNDAIQLLVQAYGHETYGHNKEQVDAKDDSEQFLG